MKETTNKALMETRRLPAFPDCSILASVLLVFLVVLKGALETLNLLVPSISIPEQVVHILLH